jgi:adenylosuccinate lyase
MPHKMNARSSERINGFTVLLRGYSVALSELAGSQWNEGDVACSVVRRVALPDSFYAMDGLLETALTVLAELGIFESAISAELNRNLPFLATTKILMAAVKKGVGRESAHEVIKEHSLATVANIRQGGENDLLARIAGDSRIPLDLNELTALIAKPLEFTGVARNQTLQVIAKVAEVTARHPQAMDYQPGAIR